GHPCLPLLLVRGEGRGKESLLAQHGPYHQSASPLDRAPRQWHRRWESPLAPVETFVSRLGPPAVPPKGPKTDLPAEPAPRRPLLPHRGHRDRRTKRGHRRGGSRGTWPDDPLRLLKFLSRIAS